MREIDFVFYLCYYLEDKKKKIDSFYKKEILCRE